MIRYTLLTILIAFLSVYAWRDWYKTLCALIVLMAFVEHPEMPKTLFGIPGLNPWNLVLLSVLMSWFVHRRVENLRFDFPRVYGLLLSCYLVVMVVGFFRGYSDTAGIVELYDAFGAVPPSKGNLLIDNLINPLKWAIPGLLLFTGAHTRERQTWAMVALLSVCILLGLQVVRWMPLGLLADGSALSDRALRVFDREIGYHRVDLAALTAGGFWAIMNYRASIDSRAWKLALLVSALIVLLALALTGGRTGYGTWAALGMFFALMRSKKYLIAVPIVGMLVLVLVPAAQERMTYGFNEEEVEASIERFGTDDLVYGGVDLNAVTSGRAIAWPFVIEKIGEAPWLGHGQLAMKRTGISLELMDTFGRGQSFPHPHNAYLELILDNGLIGAFPVLLFFFFVVKSSLRTLRDRQHAFESAVAAVTLSFIGAQMLASIGSQSFYPVAGTVVMWSAIGLQLRVLVQRTARQVVAEPGRVAPRRRIPAVGSHATS